MAGHPEIGMVGVGRWGMCCSMYEYNLCTQRSHYLHNQQRSGGHIVTGASYMSKSWMKSTFRGVELF